MQHWKNSIIPKESFRNDLFAFEKNISHGNIEPKSHIWDFGLILGMGFNCVGRVEFVKPLRWYVVQISKTSRIMILQRIDKFVINTQGTSFLHSKQLARRKCLIQSVDISFKTGDASYLGHFIISFEKILLISHGKFEAKLHVWDFAVILSMGFNCVGRIC